MLEFLGERGVLLLQEYTALLEDIDLSFHLRTLMLIQLHDLNRFQLLTEVLILVDEFLALGARLFVRVGWSVLLEEVL